MKLPTVSPGWKFLAGFTAYALVIVILTLFQDYRVAVFGFMALNALTFAMSLWAVVRSKRLVTVILALVLALTPARAGEEPPPQKDLIGIVIGCGALIVGGVIIWGILKICKKLPAPPPQPRNPPITNPPPHKLTMAFGDTNGPALIMPGEVGITEFDNWDTAAMTFQSSTNRVDWQTEYAVTNWFSNTRLVSILYSNNLPLMTNFGDAHWTNGVMVSDFSQVMPAKSEEPLKLWRAQQLQ